MGFQKTTLATTLKITKAPAQAPQSSKNPTLSFHTDDSAPLGFDPTELGYDWLEDHGPAPPPANSSLPPDIHLGRAPGLIGDDNSAGIATNVTLTFENLEDHAAHLIVVISFPGQPSQNITSLPIVIELHQLNLGLPLKLPNQWNSSHSFSLDFLGSHNVEGLNVHESDHPEVKAIKEHLDYLLRSHFSLNFNCEKPVSKTFFDLVNIALSTTSYTKYHPGTHPSRTPKTVLAAKNTFQSEAEHAVVTGQGSLRMLKLELDSEVKTRHDVGFVPLKLAADEVAAFEMVPTNKVPLGTGINYDFKWKKTYALADVDSKAIKRPWRALSVVPSTSTPLGHSFVALRGPSKEANAVDGWVDAGPPEATIDPTVFKDTPLAKNITSLASMERYLSSSKRSESIFEADMTVIPDRTMYERTQRGLHASRVLPLREIERSSTGSSLTAALTRGDVPSTLPQIDLFSNKSDKDIERIIEGMNEDQRRCVEVARSAIGGEVRVVGPPGSGKTRTTSKMAAGFSNKRLKPDAAHPSAAKDRPEYVPLSESFRTACEIMFVSKNNKNVDHWVLAVVEEMRKLKDNPIVIRMFSRISEHFNLRSVVDDKGNGGYMDDLVNIKRFMETGDKGFHGHYNAETKHAPDGTPLSNPKIAEEMFYYSMGFAMYIASGLEVSVEAKRHDHVRRLLRSTLRRNTEHWSRFRELYKKSADDARSTGPEQMTQDEKTELVQLSRELRQYVLRHADAICMTTAHALARPMYEYMRPRICFFDEAAKTTEAEYFAIRGLYPSCSRYVLVGDHHQLGVYTGQFDDEKTNAYLPQYKLSYFERGINLGYTTVVLKEEYRFPESICRLVGDTFYGGQLHPHPSIGSRIMDRNFQVMALEKFEAESPLIFLDVKDSTALASDVNEKSPYNTRTCDIGVRAVELMLEHAIEYDPGLELHQQRAKERFVRRCTNSVRDYKLVNGREVLGKHYVQTTEHRMLHTYAPKDITVISPYKGQNKLYVQKLGELVERDRPGCKDSVQVSTIDSAQGTENKVTVLDLVVGKTLGFVPDMKRMTVGSSRGMAGTIIIGDYDEILDTIHERDRRFHERSNPTRSDHDNHENEQVLRNFLYHLKDNAHVIEVCDVSDLESRVNH